MKMTRFYILVLMLLVSYNCFSQSDIQNVEKEKIRIFITKVEFGKQAEEIGMGKTEAALLLSSRITGKYEIIPLSKSDSIVMALTKNKKEPTAKRVAEELNASLIWTVRIDRLENMLRANISQVDLKGKKKKSGVGYSLVNYFEDKTNKRFYDPSLLKSIQRAFAVVVGDSLLFNNESDKLKVIPAKTLVVGGLVFVDDAKLPKWELFEKKMVNSYDAVETMIQTSNTFPNFVAYDINSRDSIYAMFNYHIIENYHQPATYELEALNKLEVEYYMTGWIQRVPDGAKIELLLYKLNGKGKVMTIVKSDSGKIQKDDPKEFRETIKKITEKIFKN